VWHRCTLVGNEAGGERKVGRRWTTPISIIETSERRSSWRVVCWTLGVLRLQFRPNHYTATQQFDGGNEPSDGRWFGDSASSTTPPQGSVIVGLVEALVVHAVRVVAPSGPRPGGLKGPGLSRGHSSFDRSQTLEYPLVFATEKLPSSQQRVLMYFSYLLVRVCSRTDRSIARG
jgi:hypothetical protein